MWIEIIEQRNMTLPIKTIGAQMNHCHFVILSGDFKQQNHRHFTHFTGIEWRVLSCNVHPRVCDLPLGC